MTGTKGTRDVSVAGYDDRLPVRGRALLPAIAMGAGAGLVVFYIAKMLAARAPLVLEPVARVPKAAAERAAPPARRRG